MVCRNQLIDSVVVSNFSCCSVYFDLFLDISDDDRKETEFTTTFEILIGDFDLTNKCCAGIAILFSKT